MGVKEAPRIDCEKVDELEHRSAEGLLSASGQSVSCISAALKFVSLTALDSLVAILVLAAVPPMVCLFSVSNCFAFVDYLLHTRRTYLDGVSDGWLRFLPEAVINGVIVFEGLVSAETLFAKFDETYIHSENPEAVRWRQPIVQRRGCWSYCGEPCELDRSYHYRQITELVTKKDLEQRISDMQSELLDFTKPLWRITHFENHVDEHGQKCSVCILSTHHSMVDGFTGLRLLVQGCNPSKAPLDKPASKPRTHKSSSIWDWLKLPHHFLTSVRKVLLLRADPFSVLKSRKYLEPEGRRFATWTTLPFSVEDLKQMGKAHDGASLNNILLAALGAALDKYAADRGEPLDGGAQAIMWVSSKPMKDIYVDFKTQPLEWGNKGLGGVYLPITTRGLGELSTARNVQQVTETVGDSALHIEAAMLTGVLKAFASLPNFLAKPLWRPLGNKVSISMSNVPGPQFETVWCGGTVWSLTFFVPPTGKVSYFFTFATWNGQVTVGVGADAALTDLDGLRSVSSKYLIDELRRMQALS